MTDHHTLISASQLQALLPEAFVADCSHELSDPSAGARDYAGDHVPSAVHFHLDHDLSSSPSVLSGRHPLPERNALASLLRARGLRHGQQVIAYDRSQGPYAARLWWLLRWLGHERVAVLDGGWQAWLAAGGSAQAEMPDPRPVGDFQAQSALVGFVQVDDVLANVRNGQRLLVDARSPERYAGQGETLDPRAGHIPGAVCRFFRNNLQSDGCFKPVETLRTEWLGVLGKRKPHEVVNQCGSGVSACHNILALDHVGLGGSLLYPGSWSEWCADPDRPMMIGAKSENPAA